MSGARNTEYGTWLLAAHLLNYTILRLPPTWSANARTHAILFRSCRRAPSSSEVSSIPKSFSDVSRSHRLTQPVLESRHDTGTLISRSDRRIANNTETSIAAVKGVLQQKD